MGNSDSCFCDDKSAQMKTVSAAEVHDARTADDKYAAQGGSVQEPAAVTQVAGEEKVAAKSEAEPQEDLPAPPPVLVDSADESRNSTSVVAEQIVAPTAETQSVGLNADTFYAEIQKDERQKLGMIIAYFSLRQCVRVRSVREDGAVARWNRENPSKVITEGHYLLEVNGEKIPGKTEKEVGELLEKSSKITLLVTKQEPKD
mmetsp:Transcript_29544/g.53822  ORF Transcript_29544/g.53822 Transcript_29544/m.53822 type:complete len:202 (-) Transcript_29544:126-731(-)